MAIILSMLVPVIRIIGFLLILSLIFLLVKKVLRLLFPSSEERFNAILFGLNNKPKPKKSKISREDLEMVINKTKEKLAQSSEELRLWLENNKKTKADIENALKFAEGELNKMSKQKKSK